jgi:hypothetical protein
MAARVLVDESAERVQPNLYIDTVFNFKVDVSGAKKRYRLACHCARKHRLWAGSQGQGRAIC